MTTIDPFYCAQHDYAAYPDDSEYPVCFECGCDLGDDCHGAGVTK